MATGWLELAWARLSFDAAMVDEMVNQRDHHASPNDIAERDQN